MDPVLSVLLVEDHAFQRRLGVRLLEAVGSVRVLEAADGFEALRVLDQSSEPIDIALVDLDLPGMDGVELIRAIAERRCVRAVGLVSAMDASVQHTVTVMAKASGMRVLGAVEKPLTREKLAMVFKAYRATEREAEEKALPEADHAQLEAALRNGEIIPHFQPQTEMVNGRVIGVEALARWKQPDGRLVGPAAFLPAMERGDLTELLTRITLDHAARSWAQWQRQGHRLRVSVNIRAADLLDPSIVDQYEAIVRRSHMPPDQLVFEVTESSVMADTAKGLGILARLRLKGFGLSIDDFGTGYSSLSQLAQIPFTELKIDRSFVSGAHLQPKNRAMIAATLDLARRLKLDVVAEGVETAEEWELLASMGCDVAQGWLVAKAVPADDVAEAIHRWRHSRYG
jgi:EAL domain-containing protein (putative c-di-GMP-specific phosphodiesterase class I)/ActR/RegA family two-component response regulator